MQSTVNLWPLIGVAVIIVGFVLRFNPMLIVAAAAVITAIAAHFPPDRILAAIGSGFIKTRNIPLIILLPLAVIGLLERHGLRERAQTWIASIKAATATPARVRNLMPNIVSTAERMAVRIAPRCTSMAVS